MLVGGLAGLLVALGPSVPTQAAEAATTFVTMVSENGEYVGGGASRMWGSGTGRIAVEGTVDSGVSVSAAGGSSGDSFTFTFAAPKGSSLEPGTYDDAQEVPYRLEGHPGIDVGGEGRACDKTTGRFTVLDVTPDLSRLWLTYEIHCNDQEPALFDEIRYREPGGDSDLLVAPGRVVWARRVPGRLGADRAGHPGEHRRGPRDGVRNLDHGRRRGLLRRRRHLRHDGGGRGVRRLRRLQTDDERHPQRHVEPHRRHGGRGPRSERRATSPSSSSAPRRTAAGGPPASRPTPGTCSCPARPSPTSPATRRAPPRRRA